jgi:UDP:flavonoid glycosyltransferase YjiC (YdhE family)
MATITLATSGTLGDHLPFVELGRSLARNGHRVRFAGSRSLLDYARRAGLGTLALRPDLAAAGARRHAEHWDHWQDRRGAAHDLVDPRGYDLPGRFDDLCRACEGADALLCASTIPIAGLVHEATGIPWLTTSVTPYHFWKLEPHARRGSGFEQGRRGSRGDAERRERRLRTLLAPAARRADAAERVDFWRLQDDFRSELGLPPLASERRWTSIFSQRVVLMASPHFSPRSILEDRDLRVADFAFYEDPRWREWRPEPPLARFLEAPDRPVVLSFGSLPVRDPQAILTRHVEAARIAGVRLLIQHGWAELGLRAAALGAASEAVHVTGFAPQDWLFQRAAAVIHHGGIGTTARTLRNGLPMLVEPYGNDQFFNARQVLSLGVGAAVHPHRATASDLARVLSERVLSDGSRASARAMGERIRAGPGTKAACDEIEAWLAECLAA